MFTKFKLNVIFHTPVSSIHKKLSQEWELSPEVMAMESLSDLFFKELLPFRYIVSK